MSTLRCPHCGTANRSGSNYCNHCGATLQEELDRRGEDVSPAAEPTDPAPYAATSALPPAEDAPSADTWSQAQPWLRPEAAPAESGAPEPPPTGDEAASAAARRLVSNVQGLLEPLRLFRPDEPAVAEEIDHVPLAAPLLFDGAQLRRWRTFLTTLPVLEELGVRVSLPRLPDLRIPWLFWLLGLAVGLPIFLQLSGPLGAPRLWPGVSEAYFAVQNLPPGSPVLLFWAYDPTTANELNLLAEPLVLHLLERQLQPVVVTLLPNGAATARRLFAQARQGWFAGQNLLLRAADAPPVPVYYLSGGPAVLPLLGQNLPVALSGQLAAPPALPTPALTIVLAAEAEGVQQWLEQVQPLDQIPVVAFTAAGADPILRPYLVSNQLRGLVSGFDGAYSYQALRQQDGGLAGPDLQPQVVAQNWGQLALLLIILMGNVAALWRRSSHE